MPTVKELQNELRTSGLPVTGLKTELIKRLNEYKNSDIWNASDIWDASVRGDIKRIIEIIKEEKKLGIHDINRLSQFGRPALHQAALVGQVNVVNFLINNGGYDFTGIAYLSGTPGARKIMRKHGFKGKCFLQLPEVKLMKAKQNLVISQIDTDYDITMILADLVKKIFIDSPKFHKTFHKSLYENSY